MGLAFANESIAIVAGWSSDTIRSKANNHGDWVAEIQTPAWGGPYELQIIGSNTVRLNDILIGEVWLCSGQSNMQWSANAGINNASSEIEAANYPNIRFFGVDHRTASYPQIDLEGTWANCTPETMQNFSAIAYFFARQLQNQTRIPIGLINSSWGGTPAESWMPSEVFTQDIKLDYASSLLPKVPWGPSSPALIYNAMIAPLHAFKIAGVLWYQGESNTPNGEFYEEIFSSQIKSWRQKWGYDFPFYFVQIAPFKYGKANEGSIIRDKQRRSTKLANTGMVVITDIGNIDDIHLKNKQDVGLRLANMALNYHYHVIDNEVFRPPYSGHTIQGSQLVVSFDHAEGLHSRANPLPYFEVAGKDGVFFEANAKIVGTTVVLESDLIKNPVFVRYAWGNTDVAQLFNSAQLPTSSFISD